MGRRKAKASKVKFPELDKTSQRLVDYWCDSLAESEQLELSGTEILNQSIKVDTQDLKNGHLQFETPRSRPKDSPKNSLIWIAPRYLSSKSKRPLVIPLWVPAVVDVVGELSIPREGGPWIPRIHLEPTPEEKSPIFGETSVAEVAFLKIFEANRERIRSSWSTYWAVCLKYFEKVSGQKLSQLDLASYRVSADSLVLFSEQRGGSSLHIQRLYRKILSNSQPLGLLPKLASLKQVRPSLYSRSLLLALKTTKKHQGQFESAFPLSTSQRVAVHRALELKNSEILCVSGPPGTGKTTLIQSIVASLWVTAAHRGDSSPPLILACGETNQSVKNIIESFSNASSAEGPLQGRWIPKLSSYGTYCCSKSKQEFAGGIPTVTGRGEGFHHDINNFEFLSQAERQFLSCFGAYTKARKDLSVAIKTLRRDLKAQVALLARSINSTATFWEQTIGGFGQLLPKDFEKRVDEYGKFDVSIRHRCFQLATHYWEGLWLLESKRLLASGNLRGDKPSWRQEEWRRAAKITPIFVSTFAMAPKFFSFYESRDKAPLSLLLVDEAGKATAEVGASAFALAERAVVVGDTEQLKPVWSVPRQLDVANLLASGLLKNRDDPETLRNLEKRGALCSSGNLMQLALSSTAGMEESTTGSSKGVFLSEHRRCAAKIIAYCNYLSYGGRLKPMARELPRRILPAVGYLHIQGRDERVGRSRRNVKDVQVITEWLKSNKMVIEEFYGLSLAEVVSVITPFVSQAESLKTSILKLDKNILVGTVGALQGAERPIIIFSSVYDSEFQGRPFFDRDTNFLNVAVSRAKHSFLIFGDTGLFEDDANKKSSESSPRPSTVLWKWVKKQADASLPNILEA